MGLTFFALCILNFLVLSLMAGDHSLVDYVFGNSHWTLSKDSREQIYIASLNLIVVSSFSSFFWAQRIPSNDDIGKVILHVIASACLVVLVLAFARIGILSRSAFGITLVWCTASLAWTRWFVFWIRPYVLIDCSSRIRQVVMMESRTDFEIIEIELSKKQELAASSRLADGILIGGGPSLEGGNIKIPLMSGLRLFSYSDFVEMVLGKVETDANSPLENYVFHQRNGYLVVRRVIDIVAALIVIPMSAPIVLIFGALIKMENAGPIFFKQERVGRGGAAFTLCKLRTMKLQSDQYPSFASQNSHRITKLGGFVRRWRIDEIPQFWNILKGDMTIIGPRPEQVDFVRSYETEIPFYSLRHVIRPGLTGWAQVKQGYAEGQEEAREKLGYDIYYLKNMSLWLDSLIAVKTFYFVIKGG